MFVVGRATQAAMGQQNFWGWWVRTQESEKREVTERGRAGVRAIVGVPASCPLPHLFDDRLCF